MKKVIGIILLSLLLLCSTVNAGGCNARRIGERQVASTVYHYYVDLNCDNRADVIEEWRYINYRWQFYRYIKL